MKHTLRITLILILLFFATQIIGLYTVNRYIDIGVGEDGKVKVIHQDTALGPPPELKQEEKSYTFIPIMAMVLIGTGLLLILIKFRLGKVWKIWFLFAVVVTITVSLDVYLARWAAAALALGIGLLRVFRPNLVIHNLSEVMVYTGITIILLPLLNIYSVIFLLLLISLYDMYAVWKSRHMVKLAKFQLSTKSFAGLSLNYTSPRASDKKDHSKKPGKAKTHAHEAGPGAEKGIRAAGPKDGDAAEGSLSSNAILGGGDIAFPLLFSATVMERLILVDGLAKADAFFYTLITTLGAGAALSFLLFFSRRERFYPAMPFISAGCFAGLGIVLMARHFL